jgi:NitT/TauT family transport system ATP-binding protein
MPKIKIENLFKTYKSRSGLVAALENVNLDIEQNEFITLVGPSGCGKSTLLKIIGALIRPSRGRLPRASFRAACSSGSRSAVR